MNRSPSNGKSFRWHFLKFESRQPGVDIIKLFLHKVCADDSTITKMLKQCYIKLNCIRTLLICSKMAYFGCFNLGGNLDFLDFLQKSFITSTTVNGFILLRTWADNFKSNSNPVLAIWWQNTFEKFNVFFGGSKIVNVFWWS